MHLNRLKLNPRKMFINLDTSTAIVLSFDTDWQCPENAGPEFGVLSDSYLLFHRQVESLARRALTQSQLQPYL